MPLIAGSETLPVAPLAGTAGFTATFVIFGAAFSVLAAVFALAGFVPVFAAVADGSVVAAFDESVCVVGAPPSVFGDGASFFPAVAASDFAAGVDGMMDSILSFSISSYPNSVLILNMLSSYETITPYSFRPPFSLNSSARADRALALKASTTITAIREPRLLGTAIKKVSRRPVPPATLTCRVVSVVLPPSAAPEGG